MQKELFALDIGTRKVMGLLVRHGKAGLEIVDMEMIEHARRPMFDGQIHSIEEVAKSVMKIKCALESRRGAKLTQVGVAVAGRNLAAYKTKVVKELAAEQEVSQEMIRDLELEAVERIITESSSSLAQHYCVGFSPVYYELDASRISTLLGHRARSIAAEVIATFLPRVVLDGMFSVLKKCGLEATNITLEPIAAMNAIIPEEMRTLNIVLVDIGAGTSDLALTKEGYVFAYGMVPEAGDEITEYISQILLTDFTTAEQIKRSLGRNTQIEYEDIWNRGHTIACESVKEGMVAAVEKLAHAIARSALEYNSGRPQAVVAVGGGSLTPGLMDALAKSFGLTVNEVGIRLPSAIKECRDLTGKLKGPEAITPIGIALMTAQSFGLRFIDVEVNTRKLRLLDFQQKKDIMGALTLSGVLQNKRLYPRPGMALTVEVNGELRIIKGTLGAPAQVKRNGRLIDSLSEKIAYHDVIEFREAVDGTDGAARIKDLLSLPPIDFLFNGQSLSMAAQVMMNGVAAGPDTPVVDRAKITTGPLTIQEVLRAQDIEVETLLERQILVNINQAPKILTQRNFTLRCNGSLGELSKEVSPGDKIEFLADTPTCYRIKDIIEIPDAFQTMHINVDGKDVEVTVEPVQVVMNGQQVRPEEFLIDGADLRVFYLQQRKIILSELFKYIEFDPYQGLGKKFKILVDDNPAGFTTPLSDGSRVRFVFEDREA